MFVIFVSLNVRYKFNSKQVIRHIKVTFCVIMYEFERLKYNTILKGHLRNHEIIAIVLHTQLCILTFRNTFAVTMVVIVNL